MNQWTGYGKIMTDPILRKTEKQNKSVCNFNLSTKNGKYGYTMIPCIAWGIVAENFVKFMAKDGIILVERSRIESRQVKLESGFTYQAIQVVMEKIKYIQSGHKEEGSKGKLGVKDPITEVSINGETEDPFEAASAISISDSDLPF